MAGAVYWVGADGNVYMKGAGGDGASVTNEGKAINTGSAGFDAAGASGVATQISDPNPPQQTTYSAPPSSGSSPTSSSSVAPTTDPNAAAAAAAAAAKAQAETNYHNNLDATNNTIGTGITAGGNDYNQSILDAFNGSGGFKSQQATIDNENVQNELSKMQGMQGVRDMVNNGVQGGGVILDNAGAGTSSAGEALARAYGIQGRQQASKVGAQYYQGKNQIDTEQGNLGNAEDNFQNVDVPTKKADIINGIVSSANQALTYLNAIAASASLPDQIDIAQRIAEIKAQATQALSAFDGQLVSSRSASTPVDQNGAQAKAASLFQAGTAPEHEFDFTSQMPAQFQNTGPAASDLPIFLNSQTNKNNNGIPAAA